MRLLRSFPLLAFAVALLGIAGYCIAAGSIGLLLVAGALAVMSWYVTEGPRGRSLPKWVSNVLLVAVLINFFVDYFQHMAPEEVMGVLGRFSVWLMLIKLYERKEPRDHAQILLLSLLLMLTACFLSNELLFGIILLLYAVLGLYVMVLFQLHSAFEAAKTARRKTAPRGYRLVPSVRAIIGRHVGLHFRTLVAGIGLMGILLSAMVFGLFPRNLGDGLVEAVRGPASGRRAGLSDDFNPTTGGRINNSKRLVATVRLLDSNGAPVQWDEPLLLRAGVFDQYTGNGEWETRRPDPYLKTIHASPEAYEPFGADRINQDGLHTLEYDWLVPLDRVLSPYAPAAVLLEDNLDLEYHKLAHTARTKDGARLIRYNVRANLAPDDALLEAIHFGSPRRRRPSIDRIHLHETQEWARQLLAEAGLRRHRPQRDPEAYYQWSSDAATVFVRFLQGEEFEYTLDLSDIVQITGMDPIEQFIFETRRGHCEYFASALAVMCQLVEIDARVVNGYMAYNWDESEQAYNILEANAHAWVEVRTGEHRWETFDPTPPTAIGEQHAASDTLADRVRWILDRFESGWENSVVAFDSASQDRLGRTFGFGWTETLAQSWDATKQWMANVNRAFRLGKAGYIWLGIVGFAMLLAVIAIISRLRRRRRMRRLLHLRYLKGAEYQRLLRQLGFYLDMLTVLHRGGHTKPDWQPPRHFALALAEQRPNEADIVRELTDTFYHARYGRRSLSRDELSRAGELVTQLASLLKVRK